MHTIFFFLFSFFFFLYKLKVCSNPVSSKSMDDFNLTAFVHFVSLCHILVILTIFQTFSLLLSLSWWSVVSDLWRYYWVVLGVPRTTPRELTPQMLHVFWLLHCLAVPQSPSLFLGFPIPRKIMKLSQLMTLQWPSRVQVRGRVNWCKFYCCHF